MKIHNPAEHRYLPWVADEGTTCCRGISQMRSFACLAMAGALALGAAGSAVADITITDANLPGNPDENVLLSNGVEGLTIIGLTNQTSTPVRFTGHETLTDPSNGQARIEATDGAFDFLEIALQDMSLGFTELEFNLLSAFDGDVTITALDNLGTEFSEVLALDANGENRINLFATNNQFITLVRIASAGDLQDIRQVRIGGIDEIGAIPEPSVWAMMILGFGGAGAMLRSRKSHGDVETPRTT